MRRKHRKGSKRPLTDQMKLAARLMFEGHRMGQIAAETGVCRQTIWRWYHRRDFQKEIERITDHWQKEKRRATHNSPEYKRAQRRKYYYRKKLPALEKKIQEAGERHDMRAYAAASKEYDRCLNEAFFGGRKASEILRKIFY